MTTTTFTVDTEHTINYWNLGATKVKIVEIWEEIIFYENKEKAIDNSCHYTEFEAMLVR